MNKQIIKLEVDKDVLDKIDDKELRDGLLELRNSKFWDIIVKYISERVETVDQMLRSTDPIKESTNMARSQGLRGGLLDLLDVCEYVRERNEEKDEDKK